LPVLWQVGSLGLPVPLKGAKRLLSPLAMLLPASAPDAISLQGAVKLLASSTAPGDDSKPSEVCITSLFSCDAGVSRTVDLTSTSGKTLILQGQRTPQPRARPPPGDGATLADSAAAFVPTDQTSAYPSSPKSIPHLQSSKAATLLTWMMRRQYP